MRVPGSDCRLVSGTRDEMGSPSSVQCSLAPAGRRDACFLLPSSGPIS